MKNNKKILELTIRQKEIAEILFSEEPNGFADELLSKEFFTINEKIKQLLDDE